MRFLVHILNKLYKSTCHLMAISFKLILLYKVQHKAVLAVLLSGVRIRFPHLHLSGAFIQSLGVINNFRGHKGVILSGSVIWWNW